MTICNTKDVDTSTCHVDACFLMFSREEVWKEGGEGVWKEIRDTKWVNTDAKKTLVSGNAGDKKIFTRTAANFRRYSLSFFSSLCCFCILASFAVFVFLFFFACLFVCFLKLKR